MPIFRYLIGASALTASLSACGKPDNDVLAEAEQRASDQAADNGRIECAINGASEFSRDCETERLAGEDGVTLIIRHPDGGFRRFDQVTNGLGVQPADGSEPAQREIISDNRMMVTVAGDRYILPARMKKKPSGHIPTTSQAAQPEN